MSIHGAAAFDQSIVPICLLPASGEDALNQSFIELAAGLAVLLLVAIYSVARLRRARSESAPIAQIEPQQAASRPDSNH
ncbi:hypothetical protein [Paraburkholderia megapolitana]|uniref:hypothetical protein n=1 Tax=Paraburkholderia megapolitana TaxID=420953 RepID=UPI000B894FA2|nr:hypothetical protein [Paraburkholderia megapolitana]QDQ81118.1 hypothetical protein FNZ07_07995 [Paraburkholderia megapolitana]